MNLTIGRVMAAVVACAGFASVAIADTQQRVDPKGDVKGASRSETFDLKAASTAHRGRDVFVHRVSGYRAGSRAIRLVRLELATGGGRPGYYVQKKGRRAGVYMYGRSGDRRVAGAVFIKHSPRSFSFRFNLEFAGLPDRYRWRLLVTKPGELGFSDKLPNRGFVSHATAPPGHD